MAERESYTLRRLISEKLKNTQNDRLISSYQILRQFEALMGGPLHATRKEAVSSSHQATITPPQTSMYSDSLLPANSADSSNLKLCQPDYSPIGETQLADHRSFPSSPDLAQSHSTDEHMNDGNEVNLSPAQQELVENVVPAVGTAVSPELVRGKSTPPSSKNQSEPLLGTRLSLFNGMELVTKAKPLYKTETTQTHSDKIENSLRENQNLSKSDLPITCINTNEAASSICNSILSDNSQPVSAFSFVNF